jgi:hypothetical protein
LPQTSRYDAHMRQMVFYFFQMIAQFRIYHGNSIAGFTEIASGYLLSF